MPFELQPHLENELIKLVPLKQDDFDILYQVASDPLIWEQHPDKYRYKREIFEKYFDGAIKSGGAFLVVEKESGKPIGSSRFYDFNEEKKSIAIGYTFIARKFWGTTYNRAMKILMLDHAFKFVDTVIFHIGAKNIRSQKAIEKLGAWKVGEIEINYPGENERLNFIYEMDKSTWTKIHDRLANEPAK
jgi:RimJ/RimL family protein N-acetyltransferase